MKDNNHVLEGDVGKTLISMSIPMFFGMLSIMLFNVVDTFYVGLLGAKELAAMGFTFPVIFIIHAIARGISIGATSAISSAIGKGKRERVRRLTTDSILLSFGIVVAVALAGYFTIEPVFSALGADAEMIGLIRQYMVPWYFGIGLLVIPMTGNSAIRATGDTKTPSIVMLIAGVINLILDPFLIFGIGPFPRLELFGAALATVISWSLTFIVAFYVLQREKMLDFSLPSFEDWLKSSKRILYLGLPSAVSNILMPIAAGILTRIISSYGTEAVAAFGVGTRLEMLSMIGITSLGAALLPIVGQNYGARKNERVREAVEKSLKYSLMWGLFVFLAFIAFANPIARAFNNDPEVVSITAKYLYIIPLSYGIFGVGLMMSFSLNAVHRPIMSAMLIALPLFLATVPLAYFGSSFFGMNGFFAGICLGNMAIGAIGYLASRRWLLPEDAVSGVKLL